MLLAVDIGNTDMTLGLFHDNTWVHVWRIPSDTTRSEIYFAMRIRDYFFESGIPETDVRHVIVSSVVPAMTNRIMDVILHVFDITAQLLNPEMFLKLPVRTANPYQIGSDLVANAIAGHAFYTGDCVVVDFGTALTFTVVKDDMIHGVAIAPGVKTALRSLASHAANLFDVPLEMPDSVFGKNTTHAIQSGVLFGYEGLVRGVVARIKKEIGNETLPIMATGGLAEVIQPLHDLFDNRNPNLTLDGLRIIEGYMRKE